MIKEPYIGMPIIISGDANKIPEVMPTLPSGTMNPDSLNSIYLGSLPLAMSYIPMQVWKTTYTAENALRRGTVFPELDLPFQGGNE